MEKVLRGKKVAESIGARSRLILEELESQGIRPRLALIRLGEEPDDLAYERSLRRYSQGLGLELDIRAFPREIEEEDLLEEIDSLNREEDIAGLMVFRPLPDHIDEELVGDRIDPAKDVDSMNKLNLYRVLAGDFKGFIPSTAQGVMELLDFYAIDLESKNVCIINRSNVVGKPLAMLLLARNATVTLAHSRTKNLAEVCRESDIVISAIGRPRLLDSTYFREDAIIIDVGMSLDEDARLVGDVDYDEVFNGSRALTPVPGGVGSITTSVLIYQMLKKRKEVAKF